MLSFSPLRPSFYATVVVDLCYWLSSATVINRLSWEKKMTVGEFVEAALKNEISLPTRDMRLHRQRVRDEMLSSLSSSDRDKELEEEVLQEVLNATQEEDTHAPREIDDRGEQIRSSIANEMWSDYSLYLNNENGNTGKREPFVWTPQMDDAFIQVMLKEQDKGNRVDGTFTSQAYANMVLVTDEADDTTPVFASFALSETK
ncbi:hypothetical protein L6452_13265 [Arctium lappa]|uniref:Uncharacterized protein n=1 Tax=Arctium lappa TaxID=4217 RepID=A0ACB9CHQ0_ARCLA|nr:hypothetical protein L6452_13265 [Arctium lappa]